jgi:hypothetical protein
MPKLKVLETRQTGDEVVVMSWSPKMDLLALGNTKGIKLSFIFLLSNKSNFEIGNVQLHRLSWQRVWQVSLALKEKSVIPELMTWHPEGLFLVVTSGKKAQV